MYSEYSGSIKPFSHPLSRMAVYPSFNLSVYPSTTSLETDTMTFKKKVIARGHCTHHLHTVVKTLCCCWLQTGDPKCRESKGASHAQTIVLS